MAEFIQTYGQSVAYGLFILILILLLLYIVVMRPKATCCSTSRQPADSDRHNEKLGSTIMAEKRSE